MHRGRIGKRPPALHASTRKTRPTIMERAVEGKAEAPDVILRRNAASDRAISPPSQAGVGFGLWLGSPVWFLL